MKDYKVKIFVDGFEYAEVIDKKKLKIVFDDALKKYPYFTEIKVKDVSGERY